LNDAVTDVQQTLTYSRRTSLNWRWLALGLVAFAFGVGFAYVRPADFTVYDWLMTAAALVLGPLLTAYALLRLLVPGKPALVLSPQGLRLHLEWVKDVLIPWREVHGVDTIDITDEFRGMPVIYPGVTVILVSKAFYDRYIHVDSLFLRGPAWDNLFIPKGSMVQVALHHEVLTATAQELRAAIEARWRAFGRATASADAGVR
jgi:hypothetical protein